jgi:hypothetical protein
MLLPAVVVAVECGVSIPPGGPASSLERSGVLGRLALKAGRRRDVSDGEGGRGVGGRL